MTFSGSCSHMSVIYSSRVLRITPFFGVLFSGFMILFSDSRSVRCLLINTYKITKLNKACVVLFGSFDRSAVNLSNLKIILNY